MGTDRLPMLMPCGAMPASHRHLTASLSYKGVRSESQAEREEERERREQVRKLYRKACHTHTHHFSEQLDNHDFAARCYKFFKRLTAAIGTKCSYIVRREREENTRDRKRD